MNLPPRSSVHMGEQPALRRSATWLQVPYQLLPLLRGRCAALGAS